MTETKQVLALGFFDGVHLGHAALLRACRDLADRLGTAAGALTFDHHPKALTDGAAPGLINTLPDRVRLLKALGMDRVLALPFDRQLMELPWQDFFQQLLEQYSAAGLVWGHDFRFGRRGAGNGALLAEACRGAGIPYISVPEQKYRGLTVSSTHIRHLLEAGEIEEANGFLGHPHLLTGQAVPDGPICRLTLPAELARLQPGAYACLAGIRGVWYPAAAVLGPEAAELFFPKGGPPEAGGPMTLAFFRRLPEGAEREEIGRFALDFFEKMEIFPLLLDKIML